MKRRETVQPLGAGFSSEDNRDAESRWDLMFPRSVPTLDEYQELRKGIPLWL